MRLASLVDREASGDPIILPDGTKVSRLPGYRRWLWDGGFLRQHPVSLGNAGRRRCLRTAWDISVMQWCRGNDEGATPLVRWCNVCKRPGRKAFVMSKSPRSQTTWRHSESSPRMVVFL